MAFAGRLGEAFGNDRFEPVDPRELMLYVISNHDAGWMPIDELAEIDPTKGLPYNLIETPFDDRIHTTSGSPNYNAKHHPYCELMASMHTWGLYHGRFGLSDIVTLDLVDLDHRPRLEKVLDGEKKRQEMLRAELANDPESAPWVVEDHLFQNYKQLQFFDTLSLYFHRSGEGMRGDETFPHVPLTASADLDVTVTPVGEGTYAFSPFSFRKDGIEFSFTGRWMSPQPDWPESSLAGLLQSIPVVEQTVRLVAA